MTAIQRVAAYIGDRLTSLVSAIAGLCLAGIIVLLVTNVVSRGGFGIGIPWIEDLTRWLMLWAVFLGVAVSARYNDHITMEAVYERLPKRLQSIFTGLHVVAGLGIAAAFLYLGAQNTERVMRLGQSSRSGELPAWIGYSALPVSALLILIAYLTFTLSSRNKDPIDFEILIQYPDANTPTESAPEPDGLEGGAGDRNNSKEENKTP